MLLISFIFNVMVVVFFFVCFSLVSCFFHYALSVFIVFSFFLFFFVFSFGNMLVGFASPGKHLLFIASVGDNFYWTGATLEAWEQTWAEPYGVNDANSPLYQIPWMSLRPGRS